MNRKMKNLGKKLGLHQAGNIVFGEYKGANICLYDQPETRGLRIKIEKALPHSDMDSLKEKYRCSRFNYEEENGYLDIVIHYSKEKTLELIEDIFTICRQKKIQLNNRCDSCGAKNIDYYQYQNQPYILCSHCFDLEQMKKIKEKKEYEAQENLYLKGVLGAVLFSLLGVFLQSLSYSDLLYWGTIPFLLYCLLVYAQLSIFGYLRFKGKQTKLSALFIILITLLMTILGSFISFHYFTFFVSQSLGERILTEIIKSDKWAILHFAVYWLPLLFGFCAVSYQWVKKWKFNFFIKSQRV